VIGKLTLIGFSEEDIDSNEPMVLILGDIEAEELKIVRERKKEILLRLRASLIMQVS
jgi:hypothetical protein